MVGIGVTWRVRLLNWFRSIIKDGHHGGQLENLETTSALEWCQIKLKLDGRQCEDREIQNC